MNTWDKTPAGKIWHKKYQEKNYAKWYAKNGRNRSPVQIEAVLKWRQDHPEGLNAYKILHKALYHGVVVKPERCDSCKKKLNGHHEDYSQPLVVLWLCYSCHQSRVLTNHE